MKNIFIKSFLFIAIAASFLTCADRDNINDPQSLLYSIGASVSPASGSTVAGHEDIVIQFSDAMDTASVESGIGGDIIKSNCKYTWSSAAFSNDTVTISIKDSSTAAFWPKGTGKLLTVDGKTSAGPSLSRISVIYDVVYRVYVSSINGDASYAGTRAKPLSKIADGIAKAFVLYSTEPSEVFVTNGTYTENSIVMKNKISVLGGFSSNNWNTTRNPTTYVSTINDTRDSGGGTTTPNAVFNCPDTITDSTNTVLDGFTINLGAGDYNTGIYCQGSLTISNNIISGKTSDTADIIKAHGIYISSGTAIITKNTIDPKNATGASNSTYGIYDAGTASEISYNTISGGGGSMSYGIYSTSGSATSMTINYNTIDCGGISSGSAYCILLNGQSRPLIDHNELTNTVSVTNMVGISESNTNADPASLTYNYFNFSASTSNHYYYVDDTSDLINASNVASVKVSTTDPTDDYLFNTTWDNTKL